MNARSGFSSGKLSEADDRPFTNPGLKPRFQYQLIIRHRHGSGLSHSRKLRAGHGVLGTSRANCQEIREKCGRCSFETHCFSPLFQDFLRIVPAKIPSLSFPEDEFPELIRTGIFENLGLGDVACKADFVTYVEHGAPFVCKAPHDLKDLADQARFKSRGRCTEHQLRTHSQRARAIAARCCCQPASCEGIGPFCRKCPHAGALPHARPVIPNGFCLAREPALQIHSRLTSCATKGSSSGTSFQYEISVALPGDVPQNYRRHWCLLRQLYLLGLHACWGACGRRQAMLKKMKCRGGQEVYCQVNSSGTNEDFDWRNVDDMSLAEILVIPIIVIVETREVDFTTRITLLL